MSYPNPKHTLLDLIWFCSVYQNKTEVNIAYPRSTMQGLDMHPHVLIMRCVLARL